MCLDTKVIRVMDVSPDDPIIAWRAWRLATIVLVAGQYTDLRYAVLAPAYVTDVGTWWPGDELVWYGWEGWRMPKVHRADKKPAIGNPNGLFAWKDERPGGTGQVLGAVYLWGRVVEHETGYRAQYASVAYVEVKQWPVRGGKVITTHPSAYPLIIHPEELWAGSLPSPWRVE